VFTNFGYQWALLRGIAIQADGKIVASGRGALPGGNINALLARWNPNGTLDPTFGSGGLTGIASPYETQAGQVAIQADGRIVVCSSLFMNPTGYGIAFRFLGNGAADPLFGNGGMSQLASAGNEALVLDGAGRIVIGGPVAGSGGSIGLARFFQ
jgi:uncharacterized delta-60 repeat protein